MNFNGSGGSIPGPVIQATDGNYYGTAYSGGSFGLGTLFKITPEGDLTTLIDFDRANGATPASGLVQGVDGNFYGTTRVGGVANLGEVFEVIPGGRSPLSRRVDE